MLMEGLQETGALFILSRNDCRDKRINRNDAWWYSDMEMHK